MRELQVKRACVESKGSMLAAIAKKNPPPCAKVREAMCMCMSRPPTHLITHPCAHAFLSMCVHVHAAPCVHVHACPCGPMRVHVHVHACPCVSYALERSACLTDSSSTQYGTARTSPGNSVALPWMNLLNLCTSVRKPESSNSCRHTQTCRPTCMKKYT